MIKCYCDICEHDIEKLSPSSRFPTRTITVESYGKDNMFVCNRCYNKMIRIIKKSNARERRTELKELAIGKDPNWFEFWKEH